MIRLLTEQDAEIYWEFRLEALQESPLSFGTTYEEAKARKNPIEQYKKNFQSNHNFTFGYFKEQNLIGVVTIILETQEKFKHKANIVAMYVSPKERRQGIAQKLIMAAIDTAKSKNIEQINLTVAAENHSAKKLYESLNFKTYGIEKNALKYKNQYYDDEFMVLSIK